MTAGFQVINNAGSILIDENYVNLAMKSKGSGSTSGPTGLNRLTVALSGLSTPMVALASPVRFVGLKNFAADMSSMLLQGEGSVTSAVNYYIFDKPTSSGVNQGLQVFDAAGGLVFDSGNKYARVVDIFGGAAEANWTPARVYPAGRTYAVVELKRAYRKEVTSLGGGNYDISWLISSFRMVGTTFEGKMIQYKEALSVPIQTAVTDNSAQYAVLDVTGY
jgi:hypothetical protein